MTVSELLTVYQYDIKDATVYRCTAYRTRASIEAQGSIVAEDTAKEVSVYEVTKFGLWKPHGSPTS